MHKSARLDAIGEQMNLVLLRSLLRHWLSERALQCAPSRLFGERRWRTLSNDWPSTRRPRRFHMRCLQRRSARSNAVFVARSLSIASMSARVAFRDAARSSVAESAHASTFMVEELESGGIACRVGPRLSDILRFRTLAQQI